MRDKDGISAAVMFAELAALRRSAGKTLLDELESISRRYGLFVSGQRAITLRGADGVARIGKIMKGLREQRPERIGPLAVLAVSDIAARTRFLAGARRTIGLAAE